MPQPDLSGTTRRQMLRTTACGFGGLAFHSMASDLAAGPLSVRAPHHAPPAKRVIFLFMAGGPSQQDLFDPKALIIKNHGKPVSPPVDDIQTRHSVGDFLAMQPIAPVRPRGESGMMISDLMPNLATLADDICLLRASITDNKAHGAASLQLHTGMIAGASPSIGSWISYGLGTENENLPSFITIHPSRDVRHYGSAYLPAAHQGTSVTVPTSDDQPAIKYLRDADTEEAQQLRRLAFTKRRNQELLGRFATDAQMEGMIESFELAFRMQTKAPELVDLSTESEETLDLYGIGENKQSDNTGRACLLARRLSEAGVRFVQVSVQGWDHHVNIGAGLPSSCAQTDKPVAGLLKDLKRRGMLDETLVFWSGEFGRSPWSQDLTYTQPFERHGREHQQESYCCWLAGGGVKGGLTYGTTDDFGFHTVENTVHLHDMHATILHQLGLDHEHLTYRHAGRDFRLTDVYGKVVHDILA